MIILAPTGLFIQNLPKVNTDSNPVTFTISNKQPPPSIPFRVVPISPSTSARVASDKIYSADERRFVLGERIYTIVSGNKVITGSTKKLFEIGEILDFDNDFEQITSIEVGEVNIQHNTNVLDLNNMGLTNAEITTIKQQSELKRIDLRNRIAITQASIKTFDIDIQESQKQINEINKVIATVGILYNIPTGTLISGNEIYDKLIVKRTQTETIKANAIISREDAIDQLSSLESELLSISQLTR